MSETFFFVLGLVCGALLLQLVRDVSIVSASWARLRNGRGPRLDATARQHIEDYANGDTRQLRLHLATLHRADLDDIEDATATGTLDALHRAAHLEESV